MASNTKKTEIKRLNKSRRQGKARKKQLEKLESGGVLVSQPVGRTRVFSFNPRYPMLDELRTLLEKTLEFYPDDVRESLTMSRRRPRRRGKPL